MSIKYAAYFGLMSLGAAGVASMAVTNLGLRVLFGWVCLSFAIVAIAYATGRPGLLLKRTDGSQPLWSWMIHWPYFVLGRFSFLLYRLTHRGRVAFAEVAPGLWFGRRMTPREARDSGVQWESVLDLAAEFPRVKVACRRYHSLPLLDGAAPTEAQLREAVAWVGEQMEHGPVLVHCALGHGRTGTVVLAWLLAQGHVPDLRSGMAQLCALRQGFGLASAQAACVERVANDRRVSDA